MKTATPGRTNSKPSMNWIWISGIAFLICFAASAVLILFGKQLKDLGIEGNIYYIILIPLGFSSAAFLAGAMKSYASFKSNENLPYGKINLSGPIVIFILVVGGGFIMPTLNKKQQFDVKARIVSKDKPTDDFNEGSVTLFIGKEPKTGKIHEGEAAFYNIPEAYHNKKVKISTRINDYQLADSGEVLISKYDDYIDIHVSRTKQSLATEVRGSIMNEKNVPVKNAFLNFGSGLATCYTNENGDFSLNIPLPPGERIRLKILVEGITRFNENVTLSGTTPIDLKIDMHP